LKLDSWAGHGLLVGGTMKTQNVDSNGSEQCPFTQ
jgi:hypothetical protein